MSKSFRVYANPSMKLGVPEISISHFGKLMCDLLEIVISGQELSEIAARVADIERIVERLK